MCLLHLFRMGRIQYLVIITTSLCIAGFLMFGFHERKIVQLYRVAPSNHAQVAAVTTGLLDRVKFRISNGTSYVNQKSQPQHVIRDEILALDMRVLKKAGLGNFIYAIASLIGLSKRSGFMPAIYEGTERLSHFPLLGVLDKSEEMEDFRLAVQGSNGVIAAAAAKYEDGLDVTLRDFKHTEATIGKRPVVVNGYLQSWKYFQFYQEEIRARFIFKRSTYISAVTSIHAQLKYLDFNNITECKACVPSLVGVHVRRGDIVNNAFGYNTASDAYIANRIQYLRTQLRSSSSYALFVVVSNDLRYCRKLLQDPDVIFIAHINHPEVDLALLTLMDHLILTVGTFGWWSAYLGQPISVWAYRSWYKNGSTLSKSVHSDDYFPPHWILTDS